MYRMPLVFLGIAASALIAGVGAASSQRASKAGVDAIFSDLTTPGSPGCALGVYRDGKIVYAHGYGLANIEENVPITPQTIFDIGSISKQFTAASILLLEQEGKLRLTDDVRKYVPELPDYSREGQAITLDQLLYHTSGLRDYVSLFLLAGIHFDNVTTDDDALGIIIRQRGLNFSPGTDWKYTGTGYFLLAQIVKRITGSSLKDFAAARIFRPLGMRHTQCRDDHTSLIPHRALAYDRDENGTLTLGVSYAEQNGDGKVQSSVEDLQKWEENFYSGQVGGQALVKEMQQPGALNNSRQLRYAKGLFLRSYRGLPAIWHAGESGGYRSYLLRFPEQHLSVACLCNGPLFPSMRSHRVAQLYLGHLMEGTGADFATAGPDTTSTVTLTAEERRSLLGNYRNPQNNDVWQVTEAEGGIRLDFEGNRRPLRPLSKSEFQPLRYIHEIRVRFEPGQNPTERKLIVSSEQWPSGPLTFETIEALAVSGAERDAYAGDYFSDELRTTYPLRMKDGRLWMQDLVGADGLVHREPIPSGELQQISAAEFGLPGPPLFFTFTRDASDVTGFVLNGFNERGIVFRRASPPH
jgi:CubicO group peptidase (beta-lactamase class C family)